MDGYKRARVLARTLQQKIKQNIFVSILLAIFTLFTVLGISGSSMAAFDQYVSGKTPGILAGEPRPIRSDEWVWQSQQVMLQHANNYPEFNKNIGLGENTTMVLDVPFRSIFVLFKPQNLFFFVLPFDNAYAAKWWFMALVLTLGFYFLITALFPKRRLLAALGALLLLFNPFTQWWYQSVTLLCIGWGLWMAFFAIKLFEQQITTKRLLLYGAGLAYTTLCFLFLLYPPFLLSVLYVVIALLAGFFYYRYFVQRQSLKGDRWRWLAVAGAMAAVLLVAGSFFAGHREVIHTINNTVYPGSRDIPSGENGFAPDGISFNIITTFASPGLFNLQDSQEAAHFYTNQSEAARITAINLLMLPIIFYLFIKKQRKDRKLADYLLIATSILGVIFIIRLFTPLFNQPFKLFLFHQVQSGRLAMGIAVLCVLQLVLLGIQTVGKLDVKKAAAAALFAFAVLFNSSIIMIHRYPGFISKEGALVACAIVSVCIFLMLQKRTFMWGFVLFLLFSMGSSIAVNPLYTRSQPVALERAVQHITRNYPDNKAWAVFDTAPFEHVPLIAGKPSFSGIQYYPQLELWRSIDPNKKAENIYNRYAHVLFTDKELPNNATFHSPVDDQLFVHFTCDIAKKLPNLGYILSPEKIDTQKLSCLKEDSSVRLTNITLRVYKYSH